MDVSTFEKDFLLLLDNLYNIGFFFGRVAVTHHIKKPELKPFGIGDFYLQNRLKYKNVIVPGTYEDVSSIEHPTVCGGVTEYLTKIKLARQLGHNLKELKFFDDLSKKKYKDLSDEKLAFSMYEQDLYYRIDQGYDEQIILHKQLIIDKAKRLSDVGLNLINKHFPIITSIDYHPEGHVMYKSKVAIKGDSDLVVNNCLIDFKNKKDYKLSAEDGAQLFAYCLHKYMRDGSNYDKVYILNPRHHLFEELVR